MTKFGLAQPVRRVEDPRLLKGNGRYTDDIVLPGMLHGIVLRSPHAAAKLGAINTTAAASVAGRYGNLYRGRPECRRHRPRCHAPHRCKTATAPPWPTRHIWRWPREPSATSATRSPSLSPTPRRRRATRPSWFGRLRHPARRHRSGHRMDTGAPLVWPDVKQQYRVRLGDWRQGGDRGVVRQGRACHEPDGREQPHCRRVDGGRAAIADYDSASGRWTLR